MTARRALGAVLVLSALGSACGSPTPPPSSVTDVEVDRARATLAEDSAFQALAKGGGWSVSQATRDGAPRSKAGIGLIVQLETSVDSSGPWKQLRCRGTVSEQFTFRYSGVETVGVVLSRDGKQVIGLQPLPSASLSFRDEDVANQPTLTPCPPGYEDPEN